MVGASPSESALLQDEPTIKIMNRLNVKYGILGNHEFDEGLEEFNRIYKGQTPSPNQFDSVVETYPREPSKMTMLSANIFDKGTTNIPFGYKPYAIEEIEGVKVGFIGVVTEEIPDMVLRKYTENYDFEDPATAIVRNAAILREQGVKAIVVIGHTSASGTDTVTGESADIIRKANQLDPENSIDIFFAAHSHTYANGVVDGVRVIQSTSQGKAFADVTGEIDKETKDFVNTPDAQVKPVLTAESTPISTSLQADPEVQSIVLDASERIKDKINEVIGKTSNSGMISRSLNSSDAKESSLGNLITDGQLEYARKNFSEDIQFAITNNGGIRADLQVNQNGEITWGTAQAVQPFGNVMQVVSIKGSDLVEALNQQTERLFLQIAGMKYTFTSDADGKNMNVKDIY